MKPSEFNLTGITVEELADGRLESVKNTAYQNVTIPFRVSGVQPTTGTLSTLGGKEYSVTQEFLAIEAVRRTVGPDLYGMPLGEVHVQQRIDATTYLVTATFEAENGTTTSHLGKDKDSDDTGGGSSPVEDKGEIIFESSSQTTHITRALDTVAAFGSVPNNPGDLVNLDANGNVQGVDIQTSCISLTETHMIRRKNFTSAYRKTLSALTKHVNSKAFRGYDPGEVLFDSFTAALQLSSGKWRVTYRFLIQSNEPAFNIGGLTVPAKYGWDYVWFCFAPTLKTLQNDDTQKAIFQRIRGGYVSRIYPYASFAPLKLPSSVFD